VTFERLIGADVLAMLTALALLFAMSADWYSSREGEEARRIERATEPRGAAGGEVSRGVEERARIRAEEEERNAWQLRDPLDRVILVALLGTALLALGAGFLRAAGRRFDPPWTPSALAAMLAFPSALLVGFRMLDQPGPNAATTVKSGAPIALVLLGLLVLACARAVRAEDAGTVWREPSIESPG
jgi:hypothetical protein